MSERETPEASDHFQPLIAKLELHAALSDDEKAALAHALSAAEVRQIGPREDLIREGDVADQVMLVLSGWACRFKQLTDGRRQIVGYLLPGDFCDLPAFFHKRMDHSIGTITPVALARIPRGTIFALTGDNSRLARSLWFSTLVAEALEREWIVNMGQRTAAERMGHLLCELFVRQRALGLTRDDSCDLPLTQSDLAEMTGLSVVHVNRTLQELRAQGLIVLQRKILTIPDLARLQKMSLFSEAYLHMRNALDPVGT